MSELKHATVGVTGMTCSACSSRVEKVLNKMDGVEAQVNLTTEKATVDYDPTTTSIHDITDRIEKVGYGIQMEKSELDVMGMTCAACSSRIKKVLKNQEGIKEATVNWTTENATVEYNPGLMMKKQLLIELKNLDMTR